MTYQNKKSGFLRNYFNTSTTIGALIGTDIGFWFALGAGSVLDAYQRINSATDGNLQNLLHSTVNVWEFAGYGGFIGAISGGLFAAKVRGMVYSFLKK